MREVKKVDLKSRPDLAIYVRALSFLEGVQFSKRLRVLTESEDMVAEQLATFVCDENGDLKFADRAAALEFMNTIRPLAGGTIVKAAMDFNDLNDEQVEDELKN